MRKNVVWKFWVWFHFACFIKIVKPQNYVGPYILQRKMLESIDDLECIFREVGCNSMKTKNQVCFVLSVQSHI